MNQKKYRVTLTPDERRDLEALVSKGKAAARTITRARVLLKADASDRGPAWTDERIKEALDVGLVTEQRAEAATPSGRTWKARASGALIARIPFTV